MQVEQPARFRCSALHLFRYRSLDKVSLYVAALFVSQVIYTFLAVPHRRWKGPPKYIVLPHVAVHTNVLSHSSTMQGRDTISG